MRFISLIRPVSCLLTLGLSMLSIPMLGALPPNHIEPLTKAIVVSHLVSDDVVYLGGDKGQILTYHPENQALDVSRIEAGGLVTSLALSAAGTSTKITELQEAQVLVSKKPSRTFFSTTSKGLIYKKTIGENSKHWRLVYGKKRSNSRTGKVLDPLFDIALIGPRHLIAVGAFGLVLESINNGETWRSIGSELDNPDEGHFYKIVLTSELQRSMHGVHAAIVGEFGQIFLLKQKKPGSLVWEKVSLPDEVTFFDGHYLSSRWMVFVGVGGALLSLDLRSLDVHASKACKAVSLFSTAPDETGRNLLIAGDQGSLIRLSLLDGGENAPPSLICRSLRTKYTAITGLSIQNDNILISTETGSFIESAVGLVPLFSESVDIQW